MSSKKRTKSSERPPPIEQVRRQDEFFEGKSFGELLCEGLDEVADALARDRQSIPKEFTCHTVTLELAPIRYTPEMVQQTRAKLGASQAVFARFLGVSVKTVCAWEQGVNVPNESACRFMDEIQANPEHFKARLASLVTRKRIPSGT